MFICLQIVFFARGHARFARFAHPTEIRRDVVGWAKPPKRSEGGVPTRLAIGSAWVDSGGKALIFRAQPNR